MTIVVTDDECVFEGELLLAFAVGLDWVGFVSVEAGNVVVVEEEEEEEELLDANNTATGGA
jgi:RecA-family ATPase